MPEINKITFQICQEWINDKIPAIATVEEFNKLYSVRWNINLFNIFLSKQYGIDKNV